MQLFEYSWPSSINDCLDVYVCWWFVIMRVHFSALTLLVQWQGNVTCENVLQLYTKFLFHDPSPDYTNFSIESQLSKTMCEHVKKR